MLFYFIEEKLSIKKKYLIPRACWSASRQNHWHSFYTKLGLEYNK